MRAGINKQRKTLNFSPGKFILGLCLGGIVALICCTHFSWKAGVFFFVIYSIVGGLLIRFDNPLWLELTRHIWICFAIVCTAEVSQLVADGSHLWDIHFWNAVLDVFCVCWLYILFEIIEKNPRKAWVSSTLIIILLSFANYYIVRFRGNALIPLDLLSYRTALNVTGNYKFVISPVQCYGVALLLLMLFSTYSIYGFSSSDGRKRLFIDWKKNVSILACITLIVFVGIKGIHIETFGNDGALRSGYLLNFLAQALELFRDKTPRDYSMAEIKNLEQEYKGYLLDGESDAPNIIVIMDESFADIGILGTNLHTDETYMPFVNGLTDNTIKGYALSSVFGGGTANSEYECLTGNTMGFLSDGATVFQMYLNDLSYSMASELSKMGYKCIATHPYLSSGWSRTKAWSMLGFNETSFVDDYPQKNLIRGFVSDQEMFEYIVDITEDNTSGNPLFIFGVTMQNHGGYDNEENDYTLSLKLNGYSKAYPDAEQYLGLISKSDKAIEWLIHYYENQEERTVILFFGDHLPNLEQDFYKEVHGGPFDTLEEKQLQYTVPFFVWANYDIEEEYIPRTSINYLSNYVYKAAGINLPPYNRFLQDIQEIIPALNSKGYYSKQRETYIPYDEAKGEEAEALNKYRILQYNSIFDTKNRSEVFFGTNK